MNLSVVLVKPKNQGNVGAIARAMANFGLNELCVVGSFIVEDEARCRAKHANDVLDKIKFYSSFDSLKDDFDVLVGTTGVIGCDYNVPRSPLVLSEAVTELGSLNGRICLIFGPEDTGLSNSELLNCDLTLHVPSCADYPVLNLSHAASIIFYEFFKFRSVNVLRDEHKLVSAREREEVLKIINKVIDLMDFRAESDRETQRVVWSRVLGKSFLTKRELFAVFGFFKNVFFFFEKNNSLK